MAVTVTTTLPERDAPGILRTILEESTASAELTPRTMAVLAEALADRRLVVAFVDDTLAGWGLRERLAPSIFELGFTYTRPEYRHEPVFRAIAHELVSPPGTYVLATYHPSMLDFLARELGFRETTLGTVVWLSRGRFLTKRLSREARRSIGSRLSTKRPRYGMLE